MDHSRSDPRRVISHGCDFEARPILEKLLELSRLYGDDLIGVHLFPGDDPPFVLTIDGNAMPYCEILYLILRKGCIIKVNAAVYEFLSVERSVLN